MKNKKSIPVEIAGYKEAIIPTFSSTENRVVDKFMSVINDRSWSTINDFHSEDDFQPYDGDSDATPPF